MATGRAPNTEGIGLETTKVELERGYVKVDGWMRTAEPHVYAIGDVIGGLMLAHVAAHEGIVAAHEIAGEGPEAIDYDHQPRATYTHPQVASIGLTEQQCEARRNCRQEGRLQLRRDRQGRDRGRDGGLRQGDRGRNHRRGVGRAYDRAGRDGSHRGAALGMTLEAMAWEIGAATHPHPTLAEIMGERRWPSRAARSTPSPARRRGYLDRFATQSRMASATSSQPGAAMSQWVRSGNSSSSVTAGEWRYLR